MSEIPPVEPRTRGRAGGVPRPSPREFFQDKLQSLFGEERLTEVLSGIAPSTRSK